MRPLPRQPQADTLPRQSATPNTILPTLPELLILPILTTTSRRLRQEDLQVTLLAARPALHETRRILGQVLVELALSVRLVDFLHEECDLVVDADDSLQVLQVRLLVLDLGHGGFERVGQWDADVVYCVGGGLGVGVVGGRDVGLVDANGVLEFYWIQREKMRVDEIGNVGEVDFVFVEELGVALAFSHLTVSRCWCTLDIPS